MVDVVSSRVLVSVLFHSSSRRGFLERQLPTALCADVIVPFLGIIVASNPSLDLQPCAHA